MSDTQTLDPTADVEISFEEATAEESKVPAPAREEAPKEDTLEILRPKAAPRKWVIGSGDTQREYIQRPLSFIAKMQWFALVGDVVDKAMSGPDGLTVSNLFMTPQARGGSFNVQDFADADTFVQAVGKLLVHAPDFLEKSYCIWLNVPDYEREYVYQLMARAPEDGGLTDDQGMEIIEVFIDQNWVALESFFRERLAQLRDRAVARRKEHQASQLSKR